MLSLYQEWKDSGESQAAFAKRQGIRPTTFGYWVKKYDKLSTSHSGGQAGGFCPIALPSGQGKAVAIIQYPSGARLEFYVGVDALYLKSLLT